MTVVGLFILTLVFITTLVIGIKEVNEEELYEDDCYKDLKDDDFLCSKYRCSSLKNLFDAMDSNFDDCRVWEGDDIRKSQLHYRAHSIIIQGEPWLSFILNELLDLNKCRYFKVDLEEITDLKYKIFITYKGAKYTFILEHSGSKFDRKDVDFICIKNENKSLKRI